MLKIIICQRFVVLEDFLKNNRTNNLKQKGNYWENSKCQMSLAMLTGAK